MGGELQPIRLADAAGGKRQLGGLPTFLRTYRTAAPGAANPWGLYDMLDNTWEWRGAWASVWP